MQHPNAEARISGMLTYHGRPASSADVLVTRRTRRERTMRAMKGLTACWGLAIAAVFVPVLHFVLVPGFAIAGPVIALLRLGEAMTVLDARGACPACGHAQTFELGERWRSRIPLRCAACRRELHLETEPPVPNGDGA